MAKERELPPPLEMACLNALWELGEGNVEEVRVCVSRGRPLAYTTVLTLLDRLSRRGAVSRRKEGRGFRYQPSIERDKLRRLALGQFLDHHFGGSVRQSSGVSGSASARYRWCKPRRTGTCSGRVQLQAAHAMGLPGRPYRGPSSET